MNGFKSASGAMDNASDCGSDDSRFKSWQAQKKINVINKPMPYSKRKAHYPHQIVSAKFLPTYG